MKKNQPRARKPSKGKRVRSKSRKPHKDQIFDSARLVIQFGEEMIFMNMLEEPPWQAHIYHPRSAARAPKKLLSACGKPQNRDDKSWSKS